MPFSDLTLLLLLKLKKRLNVDFCQLEFSARKLAF
jgi:hypothetical protein